MTQQHAVAYPRFLGTPTSVTLTGYHQTSAMLLRTGIDWMWLDQWCALPHNRITMELHAWAAQVANSSTTTLSSVKSAHHLQCSTWTPASACSPCPGPTKPTLTHLTWSTGLLLKHNCRTNMILIRLMVLKTAHLPLPSTMGLTASSARPLPHCLISNIAFAWGAPMDTPIQHQAHIKAASVPVAPP